ncbi:MULTISPECIES: PP2C family protein-serine/threonine phosphatase [unclassified Streptomyces]|uniref:PP2C family protein-serine/threonine phosphatase n=1 Tax=unclassified Streptomyces TaxID=2593676 RepID=UPI0033AC030E
MAPPKESSATIAYEQSYEQPASGVWGTAPYPVIVADRAGTVVEVNAVAASLMNGAVPGAVMADAAPSWLAEAHSDLVAAGSVANRGGDAVVPACVRGHIGDHSFEAHPSLGGDGQVAWWLVDDTVQRLAEAALSTERERATFLAEASNVLMASLNSERCMLATARLAAHYLADAAVVVTPSSGRTMPVAHAVAGQDATRALVADDPSVVPGLSEALQGFPPVPSRWIDPAALPAWMLPEGFTGPIGSVAVTPLPGHGVPAGALILLRVNGRAEFSESEELFARQFAARAGAALSAARLYAEQTDITRTLMRDLLPPELQRVNGVEFAGGYQPAGVRERVGGDFYDVHPGSTDSDPSLVVLGDVCGKGLDAAVLTGKIRNTVQALTPMAEDHGKMLQLLNGALLNSHHTRFATLVLASVLRTDNHVRLRLTSAGHPAPLVVRNNGAIEEIATHGTLVGALPHVEASTVEVSLQPGETCLLYTDGVTEARGGPMGDELFGEERLMRALSGCAGLPGAAVVERIQMLASQWLRDGRHDDMALVAITAPRTTHLSAVNGHTRGRYTA